MEYDDYVGKKNIRNRYSLYSITVNTNKRELEGKELQRFREATRYIFTPSVLQKYFFYRKDGAEYQADDVFGIRCSWRIEVGAAMKRTHVQASVSVGYGKGKLLQMNIEALKAFYERALGYPVCVIIKGRPDTGRELEAYVSE